MTSREILLFVKEEVAKYDDGKPSSLVIQAIREACLNLVSSKAAEAPGGQATINGILWLCYHALKQSQWTNVFGVSHLCPYCNAAEVDGHNKDCMAGNALRMMQEQLDQETAIMKTQMAAPEADEIERHYVSGGEIR